MKYVGIPWRAKGRAEDGVDCWGLVYLYYLHEFGIELPSLAARYEDPNTHDRKAICSMVAEHLPMFRWVEDPERGDVVLLVAYAAPSHVAVYDGGGWMLNADKSGVHRARLATPPWQNRLVGFYRFEVFCE